MKPLTLSLDEAFMNQVPGVFGVMSTDSKFLLSNNTCVQWSGFKSADAMVDLSYHNMCCPAAEITDLFIELDQKTLQQHHIRYLGYIGYASDKWRIIFGEKYLLKDADQKPIGIVSHFDDFTDAHLLDVSRFLLDSSCRYTPKTTHPQFCCTIESHDFNVNLTQRQSACLFFLLRGKSAREIGAILKLSMRTVEDHIEQIKNKLNCFTKSQLIEKAIHLGYLNIIPDSLFSTLTSLR